VLFRRSSGATDDGREGRDDGRPGPGEQPWPEDDVAAQVAVLQRDLGAIVAQANADGGRLPAGAVPTVRDIDDVLRPLLGYIERQSASDEEMRHLSAIIREYLPQALGDFTALPPAYAQRPGVTGSTPAEDLIRALRLLDEGANELQDLVYTGDADKLAVQARFLDAKFRRSDLDG